MAQQIFNDGESGLSVRTKLNDNASDAETRITANASAVATKAEQSALASHANDTSNPHSVSKSQVGLGDVDNTSDLDKPVSTATQAQLDSKASSANFNAHVNDSANPHVVTKSQVGLDNVDNTSDLDKPVSTATDNALFSKFDKSGGVITGDVGMSQKSLIDVDDVGCNTVNGVPITSIGASQRFLSEEGDYQQVISEFLSDVDTNEYSTGSNSFTNCGVVHNSFMSLVNGQKYSLEVNYTVAETNSLFSSNSHESELLINGVSYSVKPDVDGANNSGLNIPVKIRQKYTATANGTVTMQLRHRCTNNGTVYTRNIEYSQKRIIG